MDICLFTSSLYGGGAERVICNLANYLCDKDNKVTVVTFGVCDRSYKLMDDVIVQPLLSLEEKAKKNKLLSIWIRIFRLYKFYKKNSCDVVISMLPVPIILTLFMKSIIRGKVIISERNFPGIYSPITKILLKKLSTRADGYVFQTEDSMRWYGKNLFNCEIIPNAVNKNFFSRQYFGKREKKIVSVGRLDKQKNHELLLKAFSLIIDEFGEYTLHIYGEGSERDQLTKMIKNLNLERKVFLEGNVENVVEGIYKATLFVLSSDYEGMPNALIEAMSCGLPCVSTDFLGGGARVLIENGKNGYLVKCNDVTGMSRCMKMILSSEDIREKIGNNAAKINKQYSSEIIYSKWERLIKRVCSND